MPAPHTSVPRPRPSQCPPTVLFVDLLDQRRFVFVWLCFHCFCSYLTIDEKDGNDDAAVDDFNDFDDGHDFNDDNEF